MKRYIQIIILVISFLIISTLNIFALQKSPSNIKVEGNGKGLIISPTKIFFQEIDMEPGHKASKTINVKNTHEQPIKLYIKAERVTQKEEYDLLEIINLKLSYKDEVIYEGPISGKDSIEENIYLGTLKKNEEEVIYAQIELDSKKATKEYSNKSSEINWIFTATTEGDLSENVLTNIVKSPKTGDLSVVIYIITALASIILLIINRRKNK